MISAEKKIQLVHFIREDNKRNRIQLNRREQILYGKNVPDSFYEDSEDVLGIKEFDSYKGKGISGFRLRFMVSVILFLSFFYLDRYEHDMQYINSHQVINYMEDESLQFLVANVFDFKE